jgi:hypothetical protein
MSRRFPSGRVDLLLVAAHPGDFYAYPVRQARFDLVGNRIAGDVRHGGTTRTADLRSRAYRRGMDTVLNRQSISLISDTDLDHIRNELGMDDGTALAALHRRAAADQAAGRWISGSYQERLADVAGRPGAAGRLLLAQCLGVNLVVRDFDGTGSTPRFPDLAAGADVGPYNTRTRKFTDATVMITRRNEPCASSGRQLAEALPDLPSDLVKRFVAVALGRRGYVGMVVRAGTMREGDLLGFVPFGQG